MDKKNYYEQCEKCGRPFPKGEVKTCSCNFGLGEYRLNVKGCIRNKNPECPYNAVIASVTVETTDGIKNLADCFVHVVDINTTFYIDDKHRPIIIWAGPVEVELPANVQTDEQWKEFMNSFDLKGQFLYVKFFDSDSNKNVINVFYFDKSGKKYFAGQFEEIVEE